MSGEELIKIKDEYIEERKREAQNGFVSVVVHMGTCGISAGARDVFDVLLKEIEKLDVKHIKLKTTGCAGLCSSEPMVTVETPGHAVVRYGDLDAKKAVEIFYSHVLGGHVKSEYALSTGLESPQKRVAGV
ncbi:MAG: (2Fe-2S) ferredoxin domain-containing protein [Deltaproteobacteria bacterium]|nr:(2Fe-2S) ferredoxin domain-containing protein [Deltaproteobacteria bacterium]